MTDKEKIHNMASCMLSILDSLKLYDNDSLSLDNETLSEVMFRKMEAHDIDLNKELGLAYLEPVSKLDVVKQSEQFCQCGKPEKELYSPCCSLRCWQEEFE